MAKTFQKIPPNILEAICKVIGNIGEEMSGTHINKYLHECNIANPYPAETKWRRMYIAFFDMQEKKGFANDILKFIQIALHPSRFLIGGSERFSEIVKLLNQPLSFIGLEFGTDSKFRATTVSKTIDDAKNRASTLLDKLKMRTVHNDVYKYCRAELLVDNYFHAVFETTKGVADRIRYIANMETDGGELVMAAFSSKAPVLIINNFTSETDFSEHKGFVNLLIGFFGMFRNTTAHTPKISWVMSEEDALEIMTIASLCHRKLDKAQKIR